MSSIDAQQIVDRVASAVFFVEVKKANGDPDIGTAFHLGNGYFVTARHVLERNKILKVGRRDVSLKTHFATNGMPVQITVHPDFNHTEIEEPLFNHPDEKVDVTIFRLVGNVKDGGLGYPASKLQPIVPLDGKVAAFTEGQFLLQPVVVMGYPPIPYAKGGAHLVVFRGDVSAVIEHRYDHQRHFVISGMARGGFSGGPVVTSTGAALGVVTDSLFDGDKPFELGFMSATSGKAIFETIDHHKLPVHPMVH